MRFLDWFERDKAEVKIRVNSNLGTSKPIYPFSFDCQDEETAELLARHLNSEIQKFKKEIAKDFMCYLGPYEISKIKVDLNKRWDAKRDCWK